MSPKWLLLAALAAFALSVVALEAEESSGEPNAWAGPLSLAWPVLVAAWITVALARRSRPKSKPPVQAVRLRARDELVAARALSAAGRRSSAVAMLGYAVAAARRERDLETLRDALSLAISLTEETQPRSHAIDELVARANTELVLLGAVPLENGREDPDGRGDAG